MTKLKIKALVDRANAALASRSSNTNFGRTKTLTRRLAESVLELAQEYEAISSKVQRLRKERDDIDIYASLVRSMAEQNEKRADRAEVEALRLDQELTKTRTQADAAIRAAQDAELAAMAEATRLRETLEKVAPPSIDRRNHVCPCSGPCTFCIARAALEPRAEECGVWSQSLAGACDLPKDHGGEWHESEGDRFYRPKEKEEP